MCFFENDFFLVILKAYKVKVFPILVPIIANLAETHWHKLLQDSLGALRNILKDIDATLYEKHLSKTDGRYMYLCMDPEKMKKDRSKNELKWANFQQKATAMNKQMNFVIPYHDTNIVGKTNGLDNGNILSID